MTASATQLEETHSALAKAVREAEAAFEPAAAAALRSNQCPSQEELGGVLRATHRLCSRLVTFIEEAERAFCKAPEQTLHVCNSEKLIHSSNEK